MSSVLTRPISLLPAGTSFSRLVMALAHSHGDAYRAQLVAEYWRDSPEVTATLESWRIKAAVPAGSTTDSTWASPLALHGISSEALAIMRGLSVVGSLEGENAPGAPARKYRAGNRHRCDGRMGRCRQCDSGAENGVRYRRF